MQFTSPLEAALEYAARGWPVLPLHTPVEKSPTYPSGCDCRKVCEDVGKHPRTMHGVKDSSVDPSQIRRWWTMFPTANVGIDLAGARLLDIAPDSPQWEGNFIARGLPKTLTFASGGGAGHLHFLYALPEGVPQTRRCQPGEYDILSAGFAVAPPSLHRSGLSYLWVRDDVPLAEPPHWACALLAERPKGHARPADLGEVTRDEPFNKLLESVDMRAWDGTLFDGDRSKGLVAIAGELASAGCNAATIIHWLGERDDSLGWHKYSDRTDRDVRYEELAVAAVGRAASEPQRVGVATARARVNGSTPPPPAAAPATWPAPMGEAAYHGPIGAVVRGIEANSEADPAALIAHAIVIASGWLGPKAHGWAGDMPHPPRFFATIVGTSSKARKGTSSQPFRRTATLGDRPFLRIASGLSSSEGLIDQVHDEVRKWNAKKQADEIVSKNIEDKRLVVIEGELALLLRRMEREGNAISATMRDAWDSGNLETLVKTNPSRATNAHINVIAHITHEELREYLHPTEIASGFANRFLWFAAKRNRILPRGGQKDDRPLQDFADELDAARKWIRDLYGNGLIDWSDAAGERWDDGYEALSEGLPGLYGQATQRAEAQVLRISVLYAALDRSPLIELPHLEAALEVWRYSDDSARWIFGGRTGNPTADTIMDGLRANRELSRTQISNLFGRNLPSDKISAALALLLKYQLAWTFVRGAGVAQVEWWAAR